MMSASIQTVRAAHPWPKRKPRVEGVDHGWLPADVRAYLSEALTASTACVVEVGSWLGRSARFIAEHAPNAHVFGVDHFKGSPEHFRGPKHAAYIHRLYPTFCVNLWDLRGRITPVVAGSVIGMEAIAAAGAVPEVVYLDASHERDDVAADIQTARCLWPSAVLIGDDYHDFWPGVVSAVNDFAASDNGVNLSVRGRAWRMSPC